MKYRFLILLTLSAIAALSEAQTPEQQGLEIAREYDVRDIGYKDYTANMEMILINAQGEQSVRNLRTRTLEIEQDGESERRLLVFDRPADVRGTILLTASKKTRSDDQWLYFPAIKRHKRISSNNKSGPFMGSEFAYEDFSSPEVDKYTYKYLRDETCVDNLSCFVLERYPIEQDSGYSKQILWIDKAEYRLWQVHFYDRKESLLKKLKISGYKQYLGKFWRAEAMEMENVQTRKQTVLNWSAYEFHVGLEIAEFQPNRLRTIR